MGNMRTRVDDPLATITGPLYGETLLEKFKAALITEPLFRGIFGEQGERIFVDRLPSYNDRIVPLVEFWWSNERYQTRNTRLTGAVRGQILFPVQLDGKATNPNYMRRVALALQRFVGSDVHGLFDQVPGLIEFGVDLDVRYDQLFVADGLRLPAINLTIPVLFDLRLLQRQQEDIDYAGSLTKEEWGFVETYKLKVFDEDDVTLIAEDVLLETDETN